MDHETMNRLGRAHPLVTALVVAVAYYGAARLSLLLSFENTNASPVWPATGLALAAVMLFGKRALIGIALGEFIANFLVFQEGGVASTATAIGVSLACAVGNMLEALTGAWLLRRWVRRLPPAPRNVPVFAATAGLMSSVSATFGSTALFVAGIIGHTLYPTVWFTWWVGNVAGVLTVAPLLLAWLSPQGKNLGRGRRSEQVLIVATAVAAALFVFGEQLAGTLSRGYLLMPFLVWGAFRARGRTTALVIAILAGAAVVGTISGTGPFATGEVGQSLLQVQLFVCVIALLGLQLSITINQVYRGEAALRDANSSLEARVSERTLDLATANQKLQALNAELEQFSSVAAHDLKEPLRKIRMFADRLTESLAGRLDPTEQQYLSRMDAAAERMRSLIDDLLTLAQVTTSGQPFEKVELGAVAREVVEDMDARLQVSGAIVLIGELPAVAADRTQMRQLFQNMLSNAVKFQKPDTTPQISVRSEAVPGGLHRLIFSDNGIGFANTYRDQIFSAFERLHGRTEYEGTGIGLAICKRIVDRHGGTIEAEGRPGEGATFVVTIPTRQSVTAQQVPARV